MSRRWPKSSCTGVAIAAAMTGACATVPAGTVTDSVAAAEEQVALPVCPAESRGWSAWINAMPGPDRQRTLVVTGEVLLPDGARATLNEGPLDRMMPPGQRIALSIARAERAAGWQMVRLEIAPAQPAYSSVVIGCGGSEVTRIATIDTAH